MGKNNVEPNNKSLSVEKPRKNSIAYSACSRALELIINDPSSLGVSLPYLCEKLGIATGSKEYHRLRRFLMRLAKEGYLTARRIDGHLYFKATQRSVHSIQRGAKFKLTGKSAKTGRVQRKAQGKKSRPHHTVCDNCVPSGRRKHPDRNLAMLYAAKVQLPLRLRDYERLARHFSDYLEDVGKRVIVLRHLDEERLLALSYKHRFRSLRRLMRSFREAWFMLGAEYDIAVFFTVTMVPEGSLLEVARRASESWNRFMSWLQKRLGFRPKYIAVLEFQTNGAVHIHSVLFGVRSIADYRELDSYLPSIGFGRIHEEYQVVKVEKGKWVWRNKKPQGAMARGVDDYLGKYLEKSFEGDFEDTLPASLKDIEELGIDEDTPLLLSSFDEETKRRLKWALAPLKIALYFATNKRFFTCSRYARPVPKGPRVVRWVYVGSYSLDELPDWVLEAVLDGLCELSGSLEDRLAGILSLAYSYSESPVFRNTKLLVVS